MAQIVIRKEADKKIAAVSLSNIIVQRRIAGTGTSKDIKEQAVEELFSSRLPIRVCSRFSWMNQRMPNLALSLWLMSDIFILES